MKTLQASSVGYRVKALIEDRAAGELYSVHTNAAYCSIPMRPLLLIHRTDLGGIPFGVGADMETGYLKEIGLDRGMLITISDRSLIIPAANFCVDFYGTPVWYPVQDCPDNFSSSRLKINLDHAVHELVCRGVLYGLGGLVFVLNNLFPGNTRTCEGQNLICRACFEPLRQLVAGIQRQDLLSVEDALRRLIGLGIGLTPSMDDVITGLISALHRFCDRLPGGFPWVSAIGEMIGSLSSSKTTLVSRNHLLFASRGDRFEILDDLIDALLVSSRKDLKNSIEKLVFCGATSGTELAIGVLLGMKLVLASSGEETPGHSSADRDPFVVPTKSGTP